VSAQVGVVEELWRYPASALGGERLARITLAEHGLPGDRAWAVVDAETGDPAAPERAKRWRPAAQIQARTGAAGPEVAAPGGPWLSGDAACRALSAHLGFAVVIRPELGAGSDPSAAGVAPRYERAAVHLVTTASLAELDALCRRSSRIDVRRFRPNIVVRTPPRTEGCPELDWIDRQLRIGSATLRVTAPCGRCTFPTLAQPGLAADSHILRAIGTELGGHFGALCEVDVPGTMSTADEVLAVAS
jgi:uncharacterized protein YcbX